MALIVGVDGGATSTKCLAVDETGAVHGYGRGGPSNHLHGQRGVQRLRSALQGALEAALGRAGRPRVASLCLGMTGVARGRPSAAIVEQVAADYVAADHIQVYNDLEIALVGASLGQPGVLVYAGTGTNTHGVNDAGERVRVGGWGYLIDDEGGGYDIGRQALKWAFRALDGRGRPTVLCDKLKDHFGCHSMTGVRERVYQDDGLSRPEMAALALLVWQAAEEGDPVAREILAGAGSRLAETALVAIRKLNMKGRPVDVYPAGGVFRAGRWVLEPFTAALSRAAPLATVRPPRFPPVVGAVLLALRPLDTQPDSRFLNRLTTGLSRAEELDAGRDR
ncbi:MAG: BadF/BadG/BcrA/BcrD ATPase family protein [Candidatus Bipolaricaulaceae bacterium]